ncbi:mucoidy inhibitor MuiA family protein [Roseivirga pacifica]
MKKILTLLMAVFTATQTLNAQRELHSKIESVKVYTQGAEIYRTAKVQLKQGKNAFKILGLSANLDPKTIQVDGKGFTILSVRHEKDFIKKNTPEKVMALMEKQALLKDSLNMVTMRHSILENEKNLLLKNMNVVGEQGISGSEYQGAITFFTEKFEANTKKIFQVNKDLKELSDQHNLISKQIEALTNKTEEPSSAIHLVIKSDNEINTEFSLHYALSDAGWFPAYDIRAINTESPISITYKARVFQNSGIDWKDVDITLSSGNLESTGTAPKLNPYFLGGENHKISGTIPERVSGYVLDETGLPLPGTTVLIKGTTIGTPTNAEGHYSIQVPNGYNQLVFRFLGYITKELPINKSHINVNMEPDILELGEVVVTGYGAKKSSAFPSSIDSVSLSEKAQGIQTTRASSTFKRSNPIPINLINYQTTFEYKVDVPYSIPSSGIPATIDIQTVESEVDYIYSSSPKVREKTYLVAELSNWKELKLLDGESNLYFENSFIGKSIIDTTTGKDTLSVSLGSDEGIIVNRDRLKEFEQNKFFSNKKREERKFRITVVNTKDQAITINVFDQIPLAATNDYKVDIIDIAGAQLNKETGLLMWKLELKPGEKKTLDFAYTIECPKHLDLDAEL